MPTSTTTAATAVLGANDGHHLACAFVSGRRAARFAAMADTTA